jgi:hypothetical protein
MVVIFLDDDENRQRLMKSMLPCIIQTRTADETIAAIEAESRVDYLFLDHDLGGEIFVDSEEHNTGMTVAKWLVDNKRNIGTIIIHTYNHPAGQNMFFRLNNFYLTITEPFASGNFRKYVKGLVAKPASQSAKSPQEPRNGT